MRIIITGGAGLIGKELAAHWLEKSHEVIVLTRHPDQLSKGVPQGLHFEKWDGHSSKGWGGLADGAGAIVNLAGENIGAGRWTRKRKTAILQSRQNAGNAIVEAVRQAAVKPGLVIQASGVDYYGVHGEEIITDDQPNGEGFLSDVCVGWEDATLGVEQYGVRRIVSRSAVVLTTKGGAFPKILMPFRFFVGGPLGSGRQWFSWVHMHDEVEAMDWFLNTSSASGVYNLSSPNPLQNRELAKAIGQVMHRPALFPVPAPIIRLLFGEMAITVLGGQRVVPNRLMKEGFRFTFSEIKSALQDLLVR